MKDNMFNIKKIEIESMEMFETLEILEDFVACISKSKFEDIFIYKGGLALLSALKKYGQESRFRMTTDIDFHCGDYGTWLEFRKSITELSKYSPLGLTYIVEKVRDISSNGTSETVHIGVYLGESRIDSISLDMNLNIERPRTENYQTPICSLDFVGYSLESIISDKLSVLVTKRLCRRIKDLYDMYALSKLYDYSLTSLVQCINNKWKSQDISMPNNIFILDVSNIETIKHPYSKFKGVEEKPDFKEVYERVLNFIIPICDEISEAYEQDMIWNKEKGIWKDA